MAQRQWRSDDTSTWNEAFGDGSAGDYTTGGSITDSARSGFSNTTFTGTEGNSSGTAGAAGNFAAGDLILIHQSRNGGDGAGVWELNKISSIGSGTDWTLAYALTHDYATTGQVYRLLQYNNATIDTGHTLTSVAWGGTTGGIVALLAKTSITVTGTITGAGKGYRGGAGSNSQGQAYSGEGTTGASAAQGAAMGNSGGGGIGDDVQGGGGGHAAAASAAYTRGTEGAAGAAVGNAALTSLNFGGSGGGGAEYAASPTGPAGANGGGIVLLIAPTITVSGSVSVSGNTGTHNINENVGSGSGAGGSILLKGKELTLGTTKLVSAGGAAVQSWGGNFGAAGSVGRIHADYSTSISGTTSPTIDSTLDATIVEPSTGGGAFLLNFI